MSQLIKIQEGTARGEADLCKSCRHCRRTMSTEGKETRLCFGLHPVTEIKQRLASCTQYAAMSMPALGDMYDIAWEITNKGDRGRIGFITPEERRKAGIGWSPTPRGPI